MRFRDTVEIPVEILAAPFIAIIAALLASIVVTALLGPRHRRVGAGPGLPIRAPSKGPEIHFAEPIRFVAPVRADTPTSIIHTRIDDYVAEALAVTGTS